MKSVLLSIQPKWCELIASGKKTIEVRKTAPKLQTPFKCYIYCTKGKECEEMCFSQYSPHIGNGKVIGEFVCDKIEMVNAQCSDIGIDLFYHDCEKYGCLSESEINNYFGVGRDLRDMKGNGYTWHISDLDIYDTPKELGEFKTVLSDRDIRCKYISKSYNPYGRQVTHCILQNCYCEFKRLAEQTDCIGYEPIKETKPLDCPPQSWCYVED